MKLWLLKPIEDAGGHTADFWESQSTAVHGLVVRAQTEEQARLIAQNESPGYETHWSENFGPTPAWSDPMYSTCDELTADGTPGLILYQPWGP